MIPANRNLYVDYEYLNTLKNIGDLFILPNLGLPCLMKPIPYEREIYDIIGPYPFILFEDIENELPQVKSATNKFDNNLVTLSLVTLFMDTQKIQKVTNMQLDYFSFFKTYYSVKHSLPLPILNDNNRRNIRKARKDSTFIFNNKKDNIAEIFEIYRSNVQVKSLDATHAFSLEHFKFVIQASGTIVSVVKNGNSIESFYIWVKVTDKLYNHHLSGSTNIGKKNGASHLCLWESIQHFHKNEKSLLLGSNSGSTNLPNDGLSRFKKSYSNFEASTYVCGIIFDKSIYEQLNMGMDKSLNYFPLHRLII
jgi:hypothetical protein